MAQEYDKIVKENILPSITTLLQKTIGVQIVKYEVVYPELTYTVDKEADFILLATDTQGIQKLYHIEFQVKNDTNMLARMLVYHALLYHIYRVPVEQVLFFMGNASKSTMENELPLKQGVYQYGIFVLRNFSYKDFVSSDIPEVVLFGLLADFEGESQESVVTTILEKLRSISTSDLLLMRYHKQAQSLGKLRKLNDVITNLSKNMLSEIFEPLELEEEPAYLLGEIRGEAKGKAEMVYAMFAQNLDLALIATIAGLPLQAIQEMYKVWQKSL